MLMAMEKIIDIDIYKKYKLFVWVILNDMYNLDIKAVCAKNARTGMMIKMLQLKIQRNSILYIWGCWVHWVFFLFEIIFRF